ncbi:unnamed protein product [Cylicocyclus nassatus]|uniref:AB hydrolase-1 domain-containing protein n=1 Tax=Cylicocyclus nassatus TaxID=53992 RepID=A0AA36GFG1_CYLNA|nr:unnamed protein product [Cylicocyclus nassatus]
MVAGCVNMLAVVGFVIVAVPTSLWLYAKYRSKKPLVYAKKDGELFERVDKYIPALKKVYTPPWWCPFGDAQTILSAFRACPDLPFVREVIEFADGGALGIDWLFQENCPEDAPIILFLPGITGSTRDCQYILYPAQQLYEKSWRVVVYNPRGLGGVNLRNRIAYNSVRHHDVAEVVKRVSVKYPKAKMVGCGFSMGGMVLWNYLATCATKEDAILKGALVVSSPFDPKWTTSSLESFFAKHTYNRHITKKLVAFADKYREYYENHEMMNFDLVLKSVTLREFDSRFTAPLFGYESADHYYADAAPNKKVHKICVPTLCLNADDDCFSPLEAIPTEAVKESDSVVSVVTSGGGHTAFLRSANPNKGGLVDELLMEWATMLIEDLH